MTTKMVIIFYMYLQGVLASEFSPTVKFVKAGDTATITCNRTLKTFNTWQWYKEKEDGGLQDVARSVCSTTPSSSDRFEPNCTAKLLTMHIKNVKRSDSGVYYCSEPGLDQTFIVANTLIVTDPEPEEPTLSILVPVAEQNADPETMVLLCIALNWSNKWSQLKWSINEKEIDGWVTLDPDGSLRNLIFLPTRNKEKEIICYINNLHESKNIYANLSTETESLERDGDQSQCYIVLYVGLVFAVLLLVIHQIILAKRRRSFCKKLLKKQTHPERAVRFRPEDELVTYAPVKGLSTI